METLKLVEAVTLVAVPCTPVAAALWTLTHGDRHHHQTQRGNGGEGAAASRPGPGQHMASARALQLCETQPSAFPRARQRTHQLRGWRACIAPGRRPRSASHLPCREDHCRADCWRSGTSNHSAKGLELISEHPPCPAPPHHMSSLWDSHWKVNSLMVGLCLSCSCSLVS